MNHSNRRTSLAVAAVLSLFIGVQGALAQDVKAKAVHKAAKKSSSTKKLAPAPPVEISPPAVADAEQIAAAEQVYYGRYDCEFNQSIDVGVSPKYTGYVDVKHGKVDYLMKPVLSSTGAVRLEDVLGETLMVQILSKSMLLNVKSAQRLVDDCVSTKQRELVAAAKTAAMQAQTSAAGGPGDAASAPGGAESAPAPRLLLGQ